MSSDDSRALLRAQLMIVKSMIEAMDTIREQYVAAGMDKERDFLDEFLLNRRRK